MRTLSKSPLVLLWFILIQALEAQPVKVWPEVTGYLGQDVSLPCQFIQGPKHSNVTQIQWSHNLPEEEEIVIITSSYTFGVNVHDTFLKERVEMAGQSLIIKDVEMRDAGSYTCSIATFPSGLFEGTTELVVQEQMYLVPQMITAGVFLLIVVTMFAVTYFMIIRIRRDSSVKDGVCAGVGE